MKEENIKLRLDLCSKIEDELIAYKKELEKLTAKDIINKSYETAIKEELFYLLCSKVDVYDIDKIIAFTNKKNVLDSLYQNWLKTDYNISQMLEYI